MGFAGVPAVAHLVCAFTAEGFGEFRCRLFVGDGFVEDWVVSHEASLRIRRRRLFLRRLGFLRA